MFLSDLEAVRRLQKLRREHAESLARGLTAYVGDDPTVSDEYRRAVAAYNRALDFAKREFHERSLHEIDAQLAKLGVIPDEQPLPTGPVRGPASAANANNAEARK